MTDREMLIEIAKQLEAWAKQSVDGGWSTHQVKPQCNLADDIYKHIGRTFA